MPAQISAPSRPTAVEIQDTDYFVLDRGENGTTYRITGATLKATIRPYKVISGLISQSGTSAPTIIELENTTGATITTSFIDTDVYSIDATGLFVENKTWCMIAKDRADIVWNSANQLRVFALQDILDKASFEIRIYP